MTDTVCIKEAEKNEIERLDALNCGSVPNKMGHNLRLKIHGARVKY